MSLLSEAQAKLVAAEVAHDATVRAVDRARSALRRLDAQLSDARRRDDSGALARLQLEHLEAETSLAAVTTSLEAERADVERIHTALVAATDPRRHLGELADSAPFLLLPLRLETRFVGSELWIRAFPDEIAITSHEPALTEGELAAGMAFWTTSWGVDEDATAVAWRALLAGRLLARARWIARVTRPTNQPPAPPVFPAVDVKASSWSHAPRTVVMPDQLVFTLYRDGAVAHSAVGARIPSPLIVGPDPQSGVERMPDGTLTFNDEMKWIVDFDRAVAVGMAIRIALRAGEVAFDRLVVLGARISATAEKGAALLDQLLEGHDYVDGVRLVPQGTPTNNTGAASTGPTAEDLDAVRHRELAPVGPASADGAPSTDGERLAHALGVSPQTFARIPYTDRNDIAEAIAINRALWPATLGYFVDQMMTPTITDATSSSLRGFFTRFVLGRGTQPAIMVGRQPYGVLPTTALSRWRRRDSEPVILDAVDQVARRMSETWTRLASTVARAGEGSDPERVLIDVLGLQASSVTFHQRRAVGTEYLWNLAAFQGEDPSVRHLAHQAAAGALLQSLGHDFQGAPPRMLDLEVLRVQVEIARPIVDDLPLSETRTLEPNYIHWLRGNLDVIRAESYGTAVPTALLYIFLRQAVLLGAWDAGTRLLIAHGLTDATIRREAELVNVRTANELTRWDHLDAKILGVTGALSVGDFVHGGGADSAAEYREQQAALAVLAALPTARLERLFAEHIDLCSYRLDAWRLGVVAQRLETLRDDQPTGVYLGAYGWLEGIRPRQTSNVGGFIHAPSLNHAGAAAILRSAYVTHHDSTARERMSVDLSSARTRRALRYLEGMRQGQELAALLGFRFERGLHDGNETLALDQYILRIRTTFPLVSDRLHPTQVGDPIEAVEARNVVDGSRLLAARGFGYPYGVPDLPASSTPAAQAIITEVARLADDMDALADLMLAESVYQAAQGKHERASAITNGLASGILPPELEIVKTPRTGIAVTHRVCLLLAVDHPATSLWPGSSPRSRFEPQLDRWLGTLLGDPASIRVRVGFAGIASEVGFDELGFQPIDLVQLCAGSADGIANVVIRRIEATVRSREGLAAEATVEVRWAERGPGWEPTVRSLFEVMPLLSAASSLVRSRPVNAADLTSGPSDRRQDVAELHARIAAALADLHAALATATVEPWLLGSAVAENARPSGADLEVLHQRASEALAAADAASGATQLGALVSVAKLLFGMPFNPVPQFMTTNSEELTAALGAPALLANGPRLAVQEWLQGVAHVRPAIAAYENVRLLAETLGGEIETPVLGQLPFDPQARWIGLELSSASPRDGRTVSLLVHPAIGYRPTGAQLGLMVDEFVEVIPSAEEVTGVAFQQDRPASEPPQAVLLVVPPEVRGAWQWSDLAAAVNETLDLAKTRAVEPASISGTPYAQFLPAVIAAIADRPVTFSMDLGAARE